MWRTLASLLLTFGAIAWALVSTAICFFYLSSFWMQYFGRFGAFYAALLSFTLCFFGAKVLLRYADLLNEPFSGPFDESAYDAAPPDTFYRDWSRHAAEMIRNRRYAFYVRTRQWDKLHTLEAEHALASAGRAMEMPDPPHPRRTSMAHRLSAEENRRASRRTAGRPAVTSPGARHDRWRWQAIDD